jgi:hypothetical protein
VSKLIYIILLGAAAWREVPALWRRGDRREAAVWLALAAMALVGWLFWRTGGTAAIWKQGVMA